MHGRYFLKSGNMIKGAFFVCTDQAHEVRQVTDGNRPGRAELLQSTLAVCGLNQHHYGPAGNMKLLSEEGEQSWMLLALASLLD